MYALEKHHDLRHIPMIMPKICLGGGKHCHLALGLISMGASYDACHGDAAGDCRRQGRDLQGRQASTHSTTAGVRGPGNARGVCAECWLPCTETSAGPPTPGQLLCIPMPVSPRYSCLMANMNWVFHLAGYKHSILSDFGVYLEGRPSTQCLFAGYTDLRGPQDANCTSQPRRQQQ